VPLPGLDSGKGRGDADSCDSHTPAPGFDFTPIRIFRIRDPTTTVDVLVLVLLTSTADSAKFPQNGIPQGIMHILLLSPKTTAYPRPSMIINRQENPASPSAHHNFDGAFPRTASAVPACSVSLSADSSLGWILGLFCPSAPPPPTPT